MRLSIYTFLFVITSSLVYSKINNVDSLQNVSLKNITVKLDTIYNRITNNAATTTNKTTVEIKDSEKILDVLKDDGYKEYSPGFFALFTIVVSSIVSYKIATRQNSKQEEITRRQIDAQLAIAQDQLVQSRQQIDTQLRISQDQVNQNRDQMQESSRITLLQVRNNNIAAARIEWIQKLRPLLANVISISTKYSETMEDYEPLKKKAEQAQPTKEEREEIIKLLDDSARLLEEYESEMNQIKLFLNLEEDEHAKLVEALDTFLSNQWNKNRNIPVANDIDEEDLIDKSRAVLKHAWEQAKNIN